MLLDLKVYRSGRMVAKCLYAEDAAAIIALSNDGEIRFGKKVVWSEGNEAQDAGESFDFVAQTVNSRIDAMMHGAAR